MKTAKATEDVEKNRIEEEIEKALKERMVQVEKEEHERLDIKMKEERERLTLEAESKRKEAEGVAK